MKSLVLAISLVGATAGPCGGVRAADAAGAPTADPAAAIETIRGQIVALDLEAALGAIDALLARPDLPDATRADALELRAQAHVAGDDLDAAERDFRAILALRPDYAPSPDLTTKRALERFARVEAAVVGRIHLDIDPADAAIAVDGRPVTPSPARTFKALAGDRRLSAQRRGFDTAEVPVRVVAGEETLLKLTLVPNARHLVVRTDVAGVDVFLDGTAAGATAAPASGAAGDGASAELLLEDVGIGEHELTLRKSCYATEVLREIVRVDLADRSPERLRVVTMRPARARVTVTGGNYAAELRVDGETAGALPSETFTMCPGRRAIEVVAGGRTVWSGVVEAGEADIVLDLSPRPNCLLVGAEWPKSWNGPASSWSLRGRADVPDGADLASAAGWAAIKIPSGTDLALGVVAAGGVAGEDRFFLYSPALGVVEERPAPPRAGAPEWSVPSIGAALVDAPGGAMVVSTVRGGPAAAAGILPGDFVVSVGGLKTVRAGDAERAIRATPPGATRSVELAPATGARRTVELVPVPHPVVDARVGEDGSAIVRAAWAAADAAAGGADAPAALANLAALLERAGREASAREAWRKVRAIATDAPALEARADYALGVAAIASPSSDAATLFGKAKAEAEAAGDAVLAAASADRLADLGIARP